MGCWIIIELRDNSLIPGKYDFVNSIFWMWLFWMGLTALGLTGTLGISVLLKDHLSR